MDDPGSYWQRHTLSRRRVLRGASLGAAGLAGAALIGCGGDDDDDGGEPGGTAGPGGTGTAAPGDGTAAPGGGGTSGGTLRQGMLIDVGSLEPHAILSGHAETMWQAWERLTEYDLEYNVHGRLAESWEANEDLTEVVVNLRPNVKFHNGTPFTSESVAANIERVSSGEEAFGQFTEMGNWWGEVETPDDVTLILRSSGPSRPAVYDFFEFFNIAEPGSLEGLTEVIGTGPFVFAEREPGEFIRMPKNAEYWEMGKPLLDEQRFSVALDSQTATLQLEAGDLDTVLAPGHREFVRLRDSGDYTAESKYGGSFYLAGFNCMVEPFSDNRVRQAISWALDRQTFADEVTQGVSEPISLPWPEASIAYEADRKNYYSHNLEEARALLEAAGATNFSMEILLSSSVLPELVDLAAILQADLGTIGVTAEIQQQEHQAIIDRINSRRRNPDAPPDFNGMWLLNSGRAHLGAPIMMVLLAVTFDPSGINNTGYSSEEYTRVVTALETEIDPERQKQLYTELNDVFLNDVFVTPIATLPSTIVTQPSVKDIRLTVDSRHFRDAYIES